MVNTSSIYKKLVQQSGNTWRCKVLLTLADGKELDVSDSIMQGGIKTTHSTTQDGDFDIGSAVIGQCQLTIDNTAGQYDTVDFSGATIAPQIGLMVKKDYTGIEYEWIELGRYLADEVTDGSIISISALDNLVMLDRPYTTNLSYPATLRQIWADLCTICGAPYIAGSFYNSDYVVGKKPEQENLTCREMASYVAQLACSYVWCDELGRVRLGWYDSAPLPVKSYRTTVSKADTTITGVKVVQDGAEYISGEAGYMVAVEDNPLAQSDLQALADKLGQRLNGFVFRACELQVLSDPSIQAGDVLAVTSERDGAFSTVVTRAEYTIGNFTGISAEAETEEQKKATYNSPSAKAKHETQKIVEQKIDIYDVAAKQFASLVSNSMGLYTTTVKQDDGSEIYYQHDKPILEESQTIWKKNRDALAVSNDGGKTWRGMDANGNALVTVLTAVGINADWICVGKLLSKNSKVFFDLDEGKLAATKMVAAYLSNHTVELEFGSPDPLTGANGLVINVDGKYRFAIEPSIESKGTTTLHTDSGHYIMFTGLNDTLAPASNRGSVAIGAANEGAEIGVYQDSVSISAASTTIHGDLKVNGTKNRVVETSAGKVLMNAVESTYAVFEDFGTGTTDEKGNCLVELDPLFLETVSTDAGYWVQLTPYVGGAVAIADKGTDRFAVQGTPGLKFDWRVTVKQKGYESVRMDIKEG